MSVSSAPNMNGGQEELSTLLPHNWFISLIVSFHLKQKKRKFQKSVLEEIDQKDIHLMSLRNL